jgi:hypothetical protein
MIHAVIEEQGDIVTVTGNILEKRILHKGIYTRPTDEIPDQIILDFEK